MVWAQKLTPGQAAFVAKFEDADVAFFFKIMSRVMLTEIVKGPFAYQMEFPLHFLKDHAHQFSECATFECKAVDPDSTKQWPIRVTVRNFQQNNKQRVFAYGEGGWKDFFMENQLQIGDLLVFQLIGFSHFRVYVYPSHERASGSDGSQYDPSG